MQVGDRERDNHTISIDRYWHIVETSNCCGDHNVIVLQCVEKGSHCAMQIVVVRHAYAGL